MKWSLNVIVDKYFEEKVIKITVLMRCSNFIGTLVSSLEAHLFFSYPSPYLPSSSLNDRGKVAASITKHLLY